MAESRGAGVKRWLDDLDVDYRPDLPALVPPGHGPLMSFVPRPTQRRRLTSGRRQQLLNSTVLTPLAEPKAPPSNLPIMSELLEYILAHEDAFKTRGRLYSLFSDFVSQRAVNPEGYQANLYAWKQALTHAARAGLCSTDNLLSLHTSDELPRALAHNEFGRPTCLPAVIQDAIDKKDMIPWSEFMSSKTSIYASKWAISPFAAMKWGLRQLGVIGGPGVKLEVGNFVILENVEAAAKSVLNQANRKVGVDRIYSHSRFTDEFEKALNPNKKLTTGDIKVLLKFLQREKQAISFDERVIKFLNGVPPVEEPISEEDVAIAKLRDTIKELETRVNELNEKITHYNTSAREAVRNNQQTLARASLRQKKIFEKALAERTNALSKLHEVYSTIDEASGRVQIVEAMKASASALKGLHEKVGGAEGVAGVVDALREQMQTEEEITTILNEPGQQVEEVDVEDEFAALEQAEKARIEEQEAADTAARLPELNADGEALRESDAETALSRATDTMSQLSVRETANSERDRERDRVPLPA